MSGSTNSNDDDGADRADLDLSSGAERDAPGGTSAGADPGNDMGGWDGDNGQWYRDVSQNVQDPRKATVTHPRWQCPRCGMVMFYIGCMSHLGRCPVPVRYDSNGWPTHWKKDA